MVTATMLGHDAWFDFDADCWRWVDTNEPTGYGVDVRRKCALCGHPPTTDGHDFCLGKIEGVEYACCGHGIEDGYAKFASGETTVIPKKNAC